MSDSKNGERKRFAIIDGKSVFYRGYYAMPNLHTLEGVPTGGVYGFASMALEVIRRLKPDYVAVAWDKPKTNIRKRLELYPEYKAGRKPAPDDFYAQIPILHNLLDAFCWPLYELDDYEADDIMGTLAVQAEEQGIDCLLVTSDLDMLQLVGPHVKVYALKTGLSNIELYSPASFEAKYSLKVNQFLDLKALKGDSSDNIPGVPGVGEKGAIDLLQKYKTLDGIYENIELIKPSLKKKLIDGKDLAYLSKELARIWTDAPIKIDVDSMNGSKLNPERIKAELEKLQFRSLVSKLPDIMQIKDQDGNISNGTKLATGSNVLISSDQSLRALKLSAEEIYLFGRSAKKQGEDPKILGLSIDGDKTYTLEINKLSSAAVTEFLSGIKRIIGHDSKSLLEIFMELGIKDLPEIAHDTLICSFLLNSLDRELSITDLAARELGYSGTGFDNISDEELITRMPEIMAILSSATKSQQEALKKLDNIRSIARKIEYPVIRVLAGMEKTGIELDTGYLKNLSSEIDDMISDLEQEIYGYANQEFNISSPMQLADVLFTPAGLNLPTNGIKKTKTSFSTASSELDKIRMLHPIIDCISRYREVTKLKNTYIETLPKQVDKRSRLHTTFSLTTAQTGRLSSLDPNLQNIPIRTELGRHIRKAFRTSEGKMLISADYSQFELRLAAELSRDSDLIDAFNRGADIHTLTAAEVYGRQPEDVTKQMRRAAKVINFGIIYGMSPHGLTAATGMSFEQAQDFIQRYKALRKPLFAYMDSVIDKAHKVGYVENIFGRRRNLPDIHSSNYQVRQAAERAAINMPIQGTEADLMKMAMIKVDDHLNKNYPDANMLLQIHDSVLVECAEKDAEKLGHELKTIMEKVYDLSVKLVVDVAIGDNWGDL